MKAPGFHVALIVPTGIGAAIGGFGGDGMTMLPLLSAVCDTVITHPNVANAACFQNLPKNTLYVEGYALDQFFRNRWALCSSRKNRIGVIWDSGISKDMEILHRNTIAGVKTVYGVDVVDLVKTESPVALTLQAEASGRSSGRIENPEVLIRAGEALIQQGATALAVCCLMPTVDDAASELAYRQGQGVDPIGGLEAMISHLLVSRFQLPVAHAPVFTYEDALPVVDYEVDARSASEFIVSTFLPCVLTGLTHAPQYRLHEKASVVPGLNVGDLSALIVPGNALGGLPTLAAIERGIPVLAIENNQTVMEASAEALGLSEHVIPCANIAEAVGMLVALKEGITLPSHLTQRRAATSGVSTYAKA